MNSPVRTRSRRLRLIALPAVAVAAVLTLGACSSTAQSGAAAVVGGEGISDSTVATYAEEVRAAIGQAGTNDPKVNRDVISLLIQGKVIDEAAAREGITVTDSQISELISKAAAQGGLDALESSLATQYGVAPSQVQSFARTNLLYQGLVQKFGKGDQTVGSTAAGALLDTVSHEMGVSVSPRFGQWSGAQLNVVPPPNDISEPAARAAAAAAVQSAG